jgi:hypothetical protein
MWLERRRRQIQARLGMPVILRGVHAPDPAFRGRIFRRPDRVVLEYRDDRPGYFWHMDILREMFELLDQGVFDAVLRDDTNR